MHSMTCVYRCSNIWGVFMDNSLISDEEGDMNVHDRGIFYYRLLKYNVREAQKIVCGQVKSVAETNTIITRVGS